MGQSPEHMKILPHSAAGAVVLTENNRLILRQQRMPRIGVREQRHGLQDTALAVICCREITWSAHDDISVCTRMQMAFGALHVDAARLLNHAVVVDDL